MSADAKSDEDIPPLVGGAEKIHSTAYLSFFLAFFQAFLSFQGLVLFQIDSRIAVMIESQRKEGFCETASF